MQQTSRPRWQRVREVVAVVCLVGSLSGCGYTVLGATGAGRQKDFLLSIIPLNNQTREPDLERLMTAALRQTLLQSQVLLPSPDDTAAHHLHGTIRRFRSIALSFDDKDNVLQYRLEADMRVRLVDVLSKSLILEQEISAATEYLVSRGSINKVREDVVARQTALARLAQQFADKCLALLTIALL